MELWHGALRKVFKTWPKDVGHRRAILQPFTPPRRDWHEVELSSLLMLHIARMVREAQPNADFSFSEAWESLGLPDRQSA